MKNLLFLFLPALMLVACSKNPATLVKNIEGSYIGTAKMANNIRPIEKSKLVVSKGKMEIDDIRNQSDNMDSEFPLVMYWVVNNETLVLQAEAETKEKFDVESFTHKGNKVEGSGTLKDGELTINLVKDDTNETYLTYKGKKTN